MKAPETSTSLKRAAGYVRISALMGREQGADLLSDEIQREKIEAWATYRGYRVVEWYVDLDVSGREGVRRPQFERMMSDARDHRFEAVAVYRLTRFARSVKQAASAYSELRKLDVSLVSVTEDIDTTTASGSFMQNILFAMAEFESERISEEWKNVHANRRRRGLANVTRHVTGYRQNGTAELLAIEPVEAQAVRKMFAMRGAGRSYREIRDTLQVEGYVTRLGHTRFNTSVIGQILRNPIYAGLLIGPDGDLIDGKHEPLVPRDLFDRVQTLARETSRNNRWKASLLSGLLVCSGCGYRMQYAAETLRGNGYRRRACYRCPAASRSEPCDLKLTIQADIAEEYVEEEFLRHFRNPRRMPHSGKLKATRQQKEWQGRLGRLRGRLDELDRALDKLADQRYVKGSLEAGEYDRQAGRLLAERTTVEAQAYELERMIETVRPLERNVLELWPGLTVAAKRQAFRIAIANVRVKPATRRGKSQATIVGDRLEIAWLQ